MWYTDSDACLRQIVTQGTEGCRNRPCDLDALARATLWVTRAGSVRPVASGSRRSGGENVPTFGEILKQLRIERRMKQSDLVPRGMSRSLIGLYESDRRLPSYEMLQHLARTLGVSVSVFFDGVESASLQQAVATLVAQAEYAQTRREWERSIACWDSVITLCRSYHLHSHIARALWCKGGVLMELDRWQEAISTLLPLVVSAQAAIGPDLRYDALQALGHCSRQLGQIHQAHTFLLLASELVSPSDERWIATQVNIGACHCLSGDFKAAERVFLQARQQAEQLGAGTLAAWARLGWTSARLNDDSVDGVEEVLQSVEQFARGAQDAVLLRHCAHNRVTLLRLLGDVAQAKALLLSCMRQTELSPEESGALLHEQILIATVAKDEDLATSAIQELARTQIAGPLRGRLDLAVAVYYMAMGQFDLVRQHLIQARSLLQTATNPDATQLLALWDATGGPQTL